MSSTYSINVGQVTESTRKPDIFNVLEDLPNNTQKLISPRDVRDAFLTTWANSSFRVTTGATYSTEEYIGIDSGNPENRDIKQRILIGKRSFGNLDIMNSTLLNNSDADIFLYNTKSDSLTQSSTKVAILSGTNSTLHISAPYLESVLNPTGDAIDLNITNPSLFGGDINIFSTVGRVAINGIVFPTAAETATNASNGKILRYFGTYPYGSLKWDDSTVTISDIGTPGLETNIYGSPVNLNGYSLEFVDVNAVPVAVGGITQGATFLTGSFAGQDWPMSEVIRQILYPYIEPVLELSIINPITGTTYAEAGTTPSLEFDWSITTYARDDNELVRDFQFREDISDTLVTSFNGDGYGSTFSDIPGSSTYSIFNHATYSGVGDMEFSLYVSNVEVPSISYNSISGAPTTLRGSFPGGYSFSSSETISFINPIFYDYDTTIAINGTTLKTVTTGSPKLIEPYMGISHSYIVPYSGVGYLYFIYPGSFTTDIQYIKDPNGFVLYDSGSPTYSVFTHSSITHPDYTGSYRVWRTTATSSYVGAGQFEFIF
jgi:hypothetical protein